MVHLTRHGRYTVRVRYSVVLIILIYQLSAARSLTFSDVTKVSFKVFRGFSKEPFIFFIRKRIINYNSGRFFNLYLIKVNFQESFLYTFLFEKVKHLRSISAVKIRQFCSVSSSLHYRNEYE